MTVQLPGRQRAGARPTDLEEPVTKPGRRTFFRRVGAGGLVVAAATFGRAATAQAASCGCCGLAHCPPTISYSSCISVNWYSWRCFYSVGGVPYQCQCCETKNNAQSAYACWPR
jgi:hypothetical protein